MDNTTIMAAVAKLRKCADELAEIAQLLGTTAKVEISSDETARIEKRYGVLAKRLAEELANAGVTPKIVDVCEGPTIMRIRIELSPGVKYGKVTELRDNLQCALQLKSLRIEAPIPGERYVGLEIP